ncbi:MAG: hypothetical protein L0H36_03060 [bacterium]|nr:hypothetical protein [bacterium]
MQYRYDEPGVKNNSPNAVKPVLHPDHIDLHGVVPGAAVTIHNSLDRLDRQNYVFASHPYLNVHYGCLAVQVETDVPKDSSNWYGSAIKRLSDFGISSRPDGTWDQTHYTLLNYHLVTEVVPLSENMPYLLRGYSFELSPGHMPCKRDCCSDYPIEYVDIARPGYSSSRTVRLTSNWQKELYIQLKQNDNQSILIRKIT